VVPPAVIVSAARPWQAASLDGLSADGAHVVEIKCGKRAYETTAKTGTVPKYYFGQLQHILAITELEQIYYCCYWPRLRPVILRIDRDDEYIEKLIAAEYAFWQRVSSARNGRARRLQPSGSHSVSASPATYGTLTLADGSTYEGWSVNGIPNGEGTRTYPNGRVHKGGFRHGKPYGSGKLVVNGKVEIDGRWGEDGQLTGFGRCLFASGDSYAGHFKAGLRHGLGIYKWANGDQYDGAWVDNERNGLGIKTSADGSRYEGEFVDGRFHGSGLWQDGCERFHGQFRDGQLSGYGIGYILDFVAMGTWEGHNLASGTVLYENGDHYEGELTPWWTPHGIGILRLATGEWIQGRWDDGAPMDEGEGCCPLITPLYKRLADAIENAKRLMLTRAVANPRARSTNIKTMSGWRRQLKRQLAAVQGAVDDTQRRRLALTARFDPDHRLLDEADMRREVVEAHSLAVLESRARKTIAAVEEILRR